MVKEKKQRYWKVLHETNQHYDMTYIENAWNTDVLPYNPHGNCEKGGLYFTDTFYILHFLNYGNGIVEVLDWKDDTGHKNFYDNDEKVKAHSIKLGEKRLYSIELFEELIRNGADKVGCVDSLMYAIAEKDDPEMFEWFLQNFIIEFSYYHKPSEFGMTEEFIKTAGRCNSVKLLNYIISKDYFQRLLRDDCNNSCIFTSIYLAILKGNVDVLTVWCENDDCIKRLSQNDVSVLRELFNHNSTDFRHTKVWDIFNYKFRNEVRS